MFRRFRPPFEHCTRHLASFSSLYDASTSMTPRGGREISKTSQAERRVGFLFLFGFFSPASMMKQSFFFSLHSLTSIFSLSFFSPSSLRELAKREWRVLSWGERKGKRKEEAPFFALF